MYRGLCDLCGQTKSRVHQRRGTRQFICRACYRREIQPKRKCSLCGKVKQVAMRKDNWALCHACYSRIRYRDPSNHERCSECGKVKPVAMHKNEQAICPACYCRKFKPREQCSICGRVKPVNLRTADGKAVCPICYQRQYQAKMASPA